MAARTTPPLLVHLDHAARLGTGWSETAGLPLDRPPDETAAPAVGGPEAEVGDEGPWSGNGATGGGAPWKIPGAIPLGGPELVGAHASPAPSRPGQLRMPTPLSDRETTMSNSFGAPGSGTRRRQRRWTW